MTTLTAAERAIVRKPRYSLRRYVSFCPRDVVFACRSTGYSTNDDTTGAKVAIGVGTVLLGHTSNVKAGMTLDVGTTLYGREIASLRIRKDASSTELFIAETGGSDLLGNVWTNLLYLTVRDERRIWPRMPYMSKAKTGEYFDTFNYTIDYDVAYTNQTDHYPPIVNITGKMAGFIDGESETVNFQNPASGLLGFYDLNHGAAYAETSYVGATFSASSEASINTADRAFDDNLSTAWINDGAFPQWLKVQLAAAKTLRAYTVIPSAGSNNYPTAWTFEGSNNDTDWDTLDSRSGEQIIYGFAQTYEIASPGSYLYYRIVISAASDPSCIIVELDLHEDVPAQTRLNQHFATIDGSFSANAIDLYLKRTGNPNGIMTVRVETDSSNKPSGTLLSAAATGTANESDVPADGEWVRFMLDGTINVADATEYHVTLESSGSESETDFISWGYSDNNIYFQSMRLVEPAQSLWSRETDYDFLLRFGVVTGGNTRDVTLSAAGSEAVAKSASIAAYLWDAVDGEFVNCAATDATVTIRFPADRVFRYISCTVTDSNGTNATRYYPIFVHSDEHPPLPAGVGFTIDRDETTMVGREMDLTVYGSIDAAHEGLIPKGTLAVYWEDIEFDGDEPPDAYRDQFMGWISRDATRLALHQDQYFLTLSGPGYWLQETRGFALSFLDRDTPSKWYHMADPTDDRAAATILRYFTTFLDVCGMHLSGYDNEWHQPSGSDYAAIQVEKAAIWDQVTYLAAEYSGVAGCDTHGDLWLRRHPCLVDQTIRDTLDVLIDLTPADRAYDTPLELPGTVKKQYGLVQVDGFYWDGAKNVAKRARAPGRVPGNGVQEDIRATQNISAASSSNATAVMEELAGHWYAWLNGPVKDLPYALVANLDVADPARMDWVTVTENENLRGLVLQQARFLVPRVTVQHSVEPGAIPKRITWQISQETYGRRGKNILIPQSGAIDDYWFDPDDLLPGGFELPLNTSGQWMTAFKNQLALFNTDGHLYLVSDFRDAADPTYTRTNLGVGGTIQGFVVDAFSPGYLTGSGAINGWLVTTTHLYRISDIFGAVAVTAQKAFRTPSGSIANHSINASFGAEGHVVVVSYYGADGTYVTYTTDGSTWSTETQLTPYYQTDTVTYGDIFPGCHVSSKTPGKVYTTAFKSNGLPAGYVSTTYGASWAETNGTNGPVFNPGQGLADDIHVPYNHADELKAFYGAVTTGVDYVTGGWWLGDAVDERDLSGAIASVYCNEAAADDCYMLVLEIRGVVTSGTNDTIKRMGADGGSGSYDHYFTYNGSDHIEDWVDGNGDLDFLIGSQAVGDALFGAGNYRYDTNYNGTLWSDTLANPMLIAGEVFGARIESVGAGRGGDVDAGTVAFRPVYNINSPNSQAPSSGYALHMTDGATISNVSPSDGTNDYGPYGRSRWRIDTSPTDENRLLAVLKRDGDSGARVFVSSTGPAGLTPITDDNSDYRRGAIAGDNPNVIYLWGANGSIGIVPGAGEGIYDKRGNLTSMTDPAPGEFVGICGGIG